jgi:hypothetical protein
MSSVRASIASQVTISGGTISDDLVGTDNSLVIMTGGRVNGYAIFRGNSAFFYSGGTIGLGIIGSAKSESDSLRDDLDIGAGGGLGNALFAYDDAEINIIGFDLAATMIDPNFQGIFSAYELNGVLADGTPITSAEFYIQNGTGADFHILRVPEPGGPMLLASMLILQRLLRRSKTQR